jgi:hypothetical protein
MMGRFNSLAVFATASLAACGGVPVRAEVRPHAAGVVIDATTGEPLRGAQVCVETWSLWMPSLRPHERTEFVALSTDAEGRFEVEQRREWKWASRGTSHGGPPPMANRLVVWHDGYEARVVWDTRWYADPPTPTRTIELARGNVAKAACPAPAPEVESP